MTAITIQNNILDRGNNVDVTINKIDLRTFLNIQVADYFYDINNWKSVVLVYESVAFQNQTINMIFNMDGMNSQTTQVNVSDEFISDARLMSIQLIDFDNGFRLFRRTLFNLSQFDVETDAIEAPTSTMSNSTSLISGDVVNPEDWTVGFKVRLFDLGSLEYLNPLLTINSIVGNTITFDQPLDQVINTIVLQAPNNTRFSLLILNDGTLTTEPTVSPSTPRFNITQESTGFKYNLTVDNDGVLGIQLAILDDLDLPTLDNYLIASSDTTKWFLDINVNTQLQSVEAPDSLDGYALRFAFLNEVTLDQLKIYKFQ
jgi:hypothetical protein